VPVTAEVDEVVWAKHTTGRRNKNTPTISDEVNFVMSVNLLVLFWFVDKKSTNLVDGVTIHESDSTQLCNVCES
jgi:hypothetical protein